MHEDGDDIPNPERVENNYQHFRESQGNPDNDASSRDFSDASTDPGVIKGQRM